MKYDREFVLEVLKQNVCIVTFLKVDGSKREMRATLSEDLIPPKVPAHTLGKIDIPEKSQDTIQRALPADVIRCYDLDKSEWRSFRGDRLLYISILHDTPAAYDAPVTIAVEEESVDDSPPFIIPLIVNDVIPVQYDQPYVGGGGTFDGGGASVQYEPEPVQTYEDNSPSFDPPSFSSDD